MMDSIFHAHVCHVHKCGHQLAMQVLNLYHAGCGHACVQSSEVVAELRLEAHVQLGHGFC